MNTPIGGIVRPALPIAGGSELERRPIWPAFVIAVGIAATLLWTGTLVWFLFGMAAFLVT
jgi:hypothetical protein